MAAKKNPHLGPSLDTYVSGREAREPGFARAVEEEFDRLRLARKVRALREKRGLSQTELAEKSRTRQPAIARLESGKTAPTLDLLQKVAHAMGLHVEVRFVASPSPSRKARQTKSPTRRGMQRRGGSARAESHVRAE